MRNVQQERPQAIRVLVLHPENSQLENSIREYFNDKERFPIALVAMTTSPERCRSLTREVFPHVILFVDVAQDGSDWNTRLLQLSKDINLDQPGLATVILTDAKAEEMNEYYEKALGAGARQVVNVGRLGEGMVGAFGDIERAVMQAYEFIRNRGTELQGLVQFQERKLIAVGSGKGGVGKSTIASALAGEIARQNLDKRVILADFDVQFGAQAPIMGVNNSTANISQLATLSLADIANIRTPQGMDDFVQRVAVGHGGNLYLMPAPSLPLDLPAISMESTAEILSTLRRLFDYVIIDLPTRITNESITTLQMSDLILLICEQDMLSVRACNQLIQTLNDPTFGIPNEKIKVVINKVWGNKERRAWGSALVKEKDIDEFFPEMVAARFPYDTVFIQEHIGSGQPIGSSDIKAEFLQTLRQLYRAVSFDEDLPKRRRTRKPEKAKGDGLLAGLFNRKKAS